MRFSLVFLLATVLTYAALGDEAFEQPRKATVPRQGLRVYSGPGRDFYTTGQLPADTEIEVYRQLDDGWLGIRPPEGSFSWVSQANITRKGDNTVAEVDADNTVCLVGGGKDVEAHVSQVSLFQGELVQLLNESDERYARQPGVMDNWRPIAPPAGEFRWVHEDDLQEQPREPAVIVADAVDTDSNVRQVAHWERRENVAASSGERETVQVPTDRMPLVASRITRPSVSADNNRLTKIGEQAVKEVVEVPEPTATRANAPQWVSRRRLPAGTLDDLEIEFAQMVAQEMSTWRLDDIRDRLKTIAPKLETVEQRKRARVLLDRIGTYQEIENGLTETVLPLIADSTTPATSGELPAEQPPSTEYDGTGWLVPVHSTHRTAPPYALLDAEGDVLHYISPSPGLNLHRYMKKRIGVFGQRTEVPSLNKPHVTVERVVDLGRHLR